MRPAVPQDWRWTPADLVPFLRKPVSSSTRTASHRLTARPHRPAGHRGVHPRPSERVRGTPACREGNSRRLPRRGASRSSAPSVLPLQGSKQALKISQGPSTRLRAPKLRGNPPSNRLQLLSPVLGFAPARHGTAPPPRQAEQRAKPGCSSSRAGGRPASIFAVISSSKRKYCTEKPCSTARMPRPTQRCVLPTPGGPASYCRVSGIRGSDHVPVPPSQRRDGRRCRLQASCRRRSPRHPPTRPDPDASAGLDDRARGRLPPACLLSSALDRKLG